MNSLYNSYIVIDNSQERRSLLGALRSFLWRLSKDYKGVRRLFTRDENGVYYLITRDKEQFMRAVLILDLSLTSFSYHYLLNTFYVKVKEF